MLGIEGAQSRINDLMKRIRQKEFRKRTQGKCMFNLSPGSQIALSFFSTIMPSKKPNTSQPSFRPVITTELITPFTPGAGDPQVTIPRTSRRRSMKILSEELKP